MIGTQAPLVNFVTATMSSTTSVAIAADRVQARRCAATPARAGVRWWRTIPHCESVNDVNTPTA